MHYSSCHSENSANLLQLSPPPFSIATPNTVNPPSPIHPQEGFVGWFNGIFTFLTVSIMEAQ